MAECSNLWHLISNDFLLCFSRVKKQKLSLKTVQIFCSYRLSKIAINRYPITPSHLVKNMINLAFSLRLFAQIVFSNFTVFWLFGKLHHFMYWKLVIINLLKLILPFLLQVFEQILLFKFVLECWPKILQWVDLHFLELFVKISVTSTMPMY